MEDVIYTNGIINWRGFDFTYESCDKIDDMCIHVNMSGGVYAFVGGETTINNVLQPDADTIIATLLAG
jgi:hypothetical protein